MKRMYLSILLLLSTAAPTAMHAMDGGPMNGEWFSAENNPYKAANDLLDKHEWREAAKKYRELLKDATVAEKATKYGAEYDKQMARTNLASCLYALRVPTSNWAAFDTLVGIPREKQLTRKMVRDNKVKGSILVKTDKDGIGDIGHLANVINTVKEQTDADVIVSIRPMLLDRTAHFADQFDVKVISEKDVQPDTDYVTHIFGALGHFRVEPHALNPAKPIFTTSYEAMIKIRDLLAPKIKDGYTILAVEIGKVLVANVAGGRPLKDRNVLSKPFMTALRKHPKLLLLDYGTHDAKTNSGKLEVDQDLKDRVLDNPKEDSPFDTVVAIAAFANTFKKPVIVGMGADQGPANVYARGLDNEHQKNISFFVLKGKHDMRMNGEGNEYRHMFSDPVNGWRVYRSDTRDDQEDAIIKAYTDMTGQK